MTFWPPPIGRRFKTPFADEAARFSAGRLGMRLFLLSLGILFAASLIGYVVVRLSIDDWPPRGTPGLPGLLWISTAVIVVSSVAMQWALHCVRRGRLGAFRAAMISVCTLGVAFLFIQTAAWLLMIRDRLDLHDLYAWTFYFLTGLHAAHVIGGLIPMFIIARGAVLGRYGPDCHAPVHYVTMYWHFLGVVWLVLYATLLLGS